MKLLASQVTAVAFGSVPLKTYLPDGDIDLSIFSHNPRAQSIREALKDTWATQLQACLEDEASNQHAVLKVANVQVIHAEVGGVCVCVVAKTAYAVCILFAGTEASRALEAPL